MGINAWGQWFCGLGGVLLLGLGMPADHAGAQQVETAWNTTLYRSGQSVHPVYEGFDRNPDGTYTMWFGYMNRNYEEQLHIPVGSDNFFAVARGVTEGGAVDPDLILEEPGPPDRGQPTYLHVRRQSFVFEVRVPADFGDKNLVWTLRRNDETLTAIGSLQPEWVWALDEGVWRANRVGDLGGRTEVDLVNRPPTVEVDGPSSVTATVGERIILSTRVSDDGLPGPPSEERAERQEREYEFPLSVDLPFTGGQMSSGGGGLGPADPNVVNPRHARRTGLALTWVQYRGLGTAEIDPVTTDLDAEGGRSTTRVSFDRPGTYEIRAYADDTSYARSAGFTVVVQ